MKIYTNEEYKKAHVELLEILKYVSQEDKNKIPKEYIEFCIEDRDPNYKFIYDTEKNFESQNIMQLTKILIANLYIKYWASAERKKEIKEVFIDEQLQDEKKYNYDNLFKKIEKQEVLENEEKDLVPIKKNFFNKIIDIIRKTLKLT